MNDRRPTATQQGIKVMLPSLAIDLVVPLAVYGILQLAGVSVTWSLAGGAVIPVIRILVGAVRDRRINGVALFVLCTLVVGVTLTLITGDARLAIARDAVIGFALGVIFIGSLAMRRPLIFTLIRSFRGGGELDGQWERLSALRRDMRLMTLVIGVLCLADAALRVVLAYTLPVKTAGVVVHFQPIGLILILMVMGRAWGEKIRGYAAAETSPETETDTGTGDRDRDREGRAR
jgi:intracellular septation protein A